MELLGKIAILLAAAVIAVPLFRLLRLGPVLAYLAAGILIGPFALGLIGDVEAITHFAEYGIVLLLFVIGLELQPTRLWALRKVVFRLGTAQMAVVTLALGALAMLAGQSLQASLVIGFGLALASTPLVLQTLAERGQLKAEHGRAAFGVLLFQDLAVLPMLAVLPLLGTAAVGGAAAADATEGSAWIAVARLVGVFAVLLISGRLVLRPLLRLAARAGTPEVFTAAALLVVLGTSMLVTMAGLSMALGAFLAGVMLADSEFRHQLEADIEPFKGLLLGLFFIATGMSANLTLLADSWGLVLGLTAAMLLLKALLQAGVAAIAGYPRASCWQFGLTLATGGEFAFVLFALAARERVLAANVADLLVLAVTLSMIVGPLLVMLWEPLLQRWLAPEPVREFDAIDNEDPRVIIAGFGRFGQIIARVLAMRGIAFTALDANQTQVDFVRGFGSKVYYGDASRLDLLRAAGAERAEILVLAIDDVEASVRTAQLVHEQFPHLKVFARARNRQHAFQLMDTEPRYVIRETLPASLEVSREVLEALGLSRTTARTSVDRFREHDAATLLRQYAVKDDTEKLKASAREAAAQLEQLFRADSAPEPDTPD